MNFTITLYLNHFFHDHRSVCRIFVSNKMETIKHLQDHIAKIFNIKNFVLMAQNQYLPSVESVMVLNRDDVITAVPLLKSSVMCTSTPFANNQDTLDMPRNSSRILESSSDSEEERPKKRKKSTETFQKPKNLADSLEESTPLVRSFQTTLKDEDTNVTSRKEKKLKKYNLLNQDLQEPCSSQKGTEMENSSVCKEKKSKKKNYVSVREKVEYFENKDTSVLEESKLNSLDKSNDNKDVSVLNSPEKSNENSSGSPQDLDISEMMRKHKLFVKSNTPYPKLSMELPKQRNIVKSIIVKNSSMNSSGFKSIEPSPHSKNDIVSNNNSQTSFSYEKPIKFDDDRSNNNAKSYTSEKSLNIDNVNNNNSKMYGESSFAYKKTNKFNTESIEIPKSSTLEKSLKIHKVNNNSRKSMETSEKPIILQNIILQDGQDNKPEEKIVTPENNPQESNVAMKDVSNNVEMTEIEVPLSNLSMESAPISNGDTNGSTSLDQIGQHVTKRKRVRKHNSRKSKEALIETVPMKQNYYSKREVRLPMPAPILHIRFDDNEDTPTIEINDDTVPKQTNSCSNIENNNQIDKENDIDDIEMEIQREIIEDEEKVFDNSFAGDENLLDSEEKVLVDNTVHEGEFLSYVSKTVDNCPLLLNPPEVGDTIAFKILRITVSYTPEVSNYIIGKVLNVSEDQKTIMINILDGLEETRSPMGKFSLETEEEDYLSTYQEYEWQNMMEKRLVAK